MVQFNSDRCFLMYWWDRVLLHSSVHSPWDNWWNWLFSALIVDCRLFRARWACLVCTLWGSESIWGYLIKGESTDHKVGAWLADLSLPVVIEELEFSSVISDWRRYCITSSIPILHQIYSHFSNIPLRICWLVLSGLSCPRFSLYFLYLFTILLNLASSSWILALIRSST